MNNFILLIALPLLSAFIIPVVAMHSRQSAKFIGPAVLIFILALITMNWSSVRLESYAIFIGGFLPSVGIVFYIDQFSLMLSGLIALMLLVVWPWNSYTPARLYSLYMLLAAACFGLVLSADLFNLYVFYELLAVATYGLISASPVSKVNNNATALASLRYLFISSAGSVMLLLGIAIIYTLTGTLNIAHLATMPEQLQGLAGLSAFVLIVIGAGVKAEMFPVNSWVPEVYGTINVSLSALLAGLISKLAVVLIIKVLLMLFQQPEALQLLLAVGILGVISGEMVAWRAKDMIRMLSFSSIAQLGMIFIALSIAGEIGLWIGLAMMLHHLLVKGGLFLLSNKMNGSFKSLTGFAKQSPMAAAVFILFILSLLGVPPFPGFWIKLLLIMNLAEQNTSLYHYAIGFILLATVIEAAYLFKLVRILFQTEEIKSITSTESKTTFIYAQLFALILLVSMLFISPISDRLKDMASQVADKDVYIQTILGNKIQGDAS
jgi:formate hydrogenlyase subunit 3/multisubunit Na+/H+ antiporter MnhD subunit